MYTCIKVHKKMETVTLHTRMRFILPPMEGIRNSNWKGVQEEARGWGQILKVFFFREFETRIIVFIDDLTLIVMLFSQLTCMI